MKRTKAQKKDYASGLLRRLFLVLAGEEEKKSKHIVRAMGDTAEGLVAADVDGVELHGHEGQQWHTLHEKSSRWRIAVIVFNFNQLIDFTR